MSKKRILIVSLGSAGSRHLRVIRSASPDATVMVFRHSSVIEHSSLVDATTSSFSDVERFQPQFAVLANPASLHAEMARLLLDLGCHLLIEKPLATNTVDGQAIYEAAKAKGCIVHVGYNLRCLPSLQLFRDQIHQGCVGRVFSVRCEVGQSLESWRVGVDYRQGVSAQLAMGGGVLLELSHELDYLAWILGRVDWVGAWFGRQSGLEIDVEDTAHLVLGFQSAGALAPVASVNLDFIRHDTTRRCVAIGENGSLTWDAVKGTVEACFKGNAEWQVMHRSKPDQDFTYAAQWHRFLSAAVHPNGRQDSLAADIDQALHVLDVVEAARSSCDQNGIRVRLPLKERHGQQ